MTRRERVIAFIFARGGSKGVPGKNVKPLGGKPLIAWAIDTARACPQVETVIVSTDDAEIASVARTHGAEVPFERPTELATDTASEWLAWQHAIRWVESNRGPFDTFISVPTTSPFRAPSDVIGCIETLHADPKADIVITIREAERSPYFNMVRLDGEGYARRVIEPDGAIGRRQDAPVVFDMTTVAYAARPSFVLRANGLFDGVVRTVTVPAERALDIDTPYEFMIAECIARQRQAQAPTHLDHTTST
jgi:N-acylneuraminate cytidylyltransferase